MRSWGLVWGVVGMRALSIGNVRGRWSEEGDRSRILRRRHRLVTGAGREIVQLARFREVGIGVGDGGVGSESGFACAGTVDDDFEILDDDSVELESATIDEKTVIVSDFGWILDGVLAVRRSEDLDCADVLVRIPFSYSHDALEKVMIFDNDVRAFLHHLPNPDVGVSGLDFHRKTLDLYGADFRWGFLSDTIRAE